MRKFIWCSTHAPTVEQVAELYSAWGMEGSLIALKDINPSLQELLNNCPNNHDDLIKLATLLHELSREEDAVLVQPGSSLAFQYVLGKVRMTALRMSTVLYAHSERVSEDIPQEDGSVKKVSVFKHLKFVQV